MKYFLMLLFIFIIICIVPACSEEQYCENPYVTHYDIVELYDGSEYLSPVMGCSQ